MRILLWAILIQLMVLNVHGCIANDRLRNIERSRIVVTCTETK